MVRLGIQLTFFAMAPSVFSSCFGGIKYLCTQIGLALPIELTAFMVQLVAILAYTCVCGRFFCGYACAFGTLGDVLFGIGAAVQGKLGHRLPTFPERLVRLLSLLKYVILAAICIACFVGAWPAVSDKSPWAGFASVLALNVDDTNAVALALLAALACLMVLRERAFCQFFCPLGAVFSLMPVLPIAEFVRMREHCARRCGRCHETCPMSIWPDADRLEHGECISCGRCADQCPMANINQLALQKDLSLAEQLLSHGDVQEDHTPQPLRKTREAWRLLRGTEPWLVLLRAAILLLLCWLLGAVRYLPALPL